LARNCENRPNNIDSDDDDGDNDDDKSKGEKMDINVPLARPFVMDEWILMGVGFERGFGTEDSCWANKSFPYF